MSKTLVSIIMGVYNEEITLERCLNSIIDQTYDNWELIVCDDCSDDGTVGILEKYIKKDNRIKLLRNEKNIRLAASLNKCLDAAKGEYIARMDADDISLPNRLEKQVKFLEEHEDIDCVGSNMVVFDESGDKGVRESIEKPIKKDMLCKAPFFHPTIMMRKSVYDDLGGYTVSPETMRAEDLDLWFRFFKRGYKGYNIQENLYRYHESTTDYKKRTLKAAIKTAMVYIGGFKMLGFSKIKYLYAMRPIISAILPNRFMEKYHCSKLVLKKG